MYEKFVSFLFSYMTMKYDRNFVIVKLTNIYKNTRYLANYNKTCKLFQKTN